MTQPEGPLKSSGNVPAGAALVVLSALCFAVGGLTVKLVATNFDPLMLVFWRNLLSAILVFAWFAVTGLPVAAVTKTNVHALRAILTYAGLVTYFTAIITIPLADGVLLRASSPIFVPVLAWLFFGRLSDRHVWVGVTIGFVGVGCIIGPQFSSIGWGTVMGVLSGLFGGGAAISMWLLSRGEGAGSQMFWLSLFSLAFSALPLPWLWQVPPSTAWPALIALAVSTTLAQALLAMATATAPTDKILTWGYTSVVFAAIFGYLGWGETISSTGLVGMALAVLGGHWATRPGRKS